MSLVSGSYGNLKRGFGFNLALTLLNKSLRAIGGMTAGNALWVVITRRYSKILSTLASAAPSPSCNLKTCLGHVYLVGGVDVKICDIRQLF